MDVGMKNKYRREEYSKQVRSKKRGHKEQSQEVMKARVRLDETSVRAVKKDRRDREITK